MVLNKIARHITVKNRYICTSNIFGNQSGKNKEKQKIALVKTDEAQRFMTDCFLAVNTPLLHAVEMSEVLFNADYRGHYSHGMNRLEMYINDIIKGTTDCCATPTIYKETAATAWVNGQNALGAVVGNFSIDLAIKKAKEVGVGWVCANNSNHYGIAGWYSMRAQNQGLIGLSMTNTSPLMSPTRSKRPALGTNPLTIAAPANNSDSFVLDMATTAVAVGKIEMQRRKKEPIPIGWAQDPEGKTTTDSEVAFQTGSLMPLGGSELTSGYKGYGLAALVEIFCGISAGANFSTHVRKWSHGGGKNPANLGQCFIAVDPNCFAPCFTDRLSELLEILRALPRTKESKPVLVAGDQERFHMKYVDDADGIEYHINQVKACEALASRLNVKKIDFLIKEVIKSQ